METSPHETDDIRDRTHVFISYSHNDTKLMKRLAKDLRDASIPIWVDLDSMRKTAPSWDRELREVILHSHVLVLIATKNSALSDTVKGELLLARSHGVPILPLWMDGDKWSDCIPLSMANWQHSDCRGTRYQFELPNVIGVIRNIIEPRIVTSILDIPNVNQEASAKLLAYQPLNMLIVRFATTDLKRIEWADEDRKVDELVRQISKFQEIKVTRAYVSTTEDLLKVLKEDAFEVVQFSGDMGTNSISVLESYLPGSRTDHPQEVTLSVETLGNYISFAQPSVRVLLFICCCALSSIEALVAIAPYTVAVEAKYPSPAPWVFVKEFYQSYFEHRSVHSAYEDARVHLDARNYADTINPIMVPRERYNPDGRLLVEVRIQGVPDPVTMDLTAVAQSLDSFGVRREQLIATLATKIRAHRAIFNTPRDNAILAVGPILYGMFTWDTAKGYIRCAKLFKFRDTADPNHWREWCKLLRVYNELCAKDYRVLPEPGNPTARTPLLGAVHRFIASYDSLDSSIGTLVHLGFRLAEFSYISGKEELEAAKQSAREQNWDMTVTHLETALTTLHDILNTTMPAIETGY